MPFAAVGAIAGVAGAVINSSAAGDAAAAQQQAAQSAAQVQQNMFNTTQSNAAPYIQGGNSALDNLENGLGLSMGPSPTYTSTPNSTGSITSGSTTSPNYTATPYTGGTNSNTNVGSTGTGTTTGNAVSGLTPGETMAQRLANGNPYANQSGFNSQANQSIVNSQRQNGSSSNQNQSQVPIGFTPTATNATGSLLQKEYTPFTGADIQNTPGYQFQLQQGLNGITNAMSKSGGANSNNLEGLLQFNQGLAGTEYQNALANYMAQFQQGNAVTQQNFNNTALIAQLGENAGQGLGNQSVAAGGNIGNNIVGAGQASASGSVGQANAITGGLSNAYNQYAQQQALNGINSGNNLSLDQSQVSSLANGGSGNSFSSYFPTSSGSNSYGFGGTDSFGQ